MSQAKLALAILWHHHQPYYKSSSGVYQMPWVRFHSTKDYLDLLLVLKEFPAIKQNFNLVPSLLLQIQDYVENKATDLIWNLTAIPADKLTAEDKEKILDNFFIININNMVKPYPRYYELYLKLKNFLRDESLDRHLQAFSVEEYRDLQVWYNLSWIGVESRRQPEIAKLFRKGRLFTEEDKKTLLQEIKKIMGNIVPTFREMWNANQIELSTSPFYHSILPLLCNSGIGKESDPNIILPSHPFIHPEDAEWQVKKALDYFEKIFSRKPIGMWPSEGSVSLEALEIIARQGIAWTATDEGILAHTLREKFSQTRIYQPYILQTGKNNIHIFFRDHYLSDAIGFVYSNWPFEQAVSDLIGRLHSIRTLLIDHYGQESLSRFVVPIILDGENCWEYYEADGKPFLRHLYQTLTDDHLIETITLGQMLNRNKKPDKLTTIHPGSWINSNFNIWIGSEEDNRAWDVLTQTRQFLVKQEKEGIHDETVIKQAWEKIFIAEGSDWNWWYGEEHSSANDVEFDSLYREHLMEIYRLLNQEIPPILYQTIKTKHYDHFQSDRPKNFIHPILDGRSSHFYEWVGAAVYEVAKTPQSAMHQVTRILDKLYVGFNAEMFFLRLDFLSKPDPLLEFVLAIKRPRSITVVLSPLRGVLEKYEWHGEIQKRYSLRPTYKLDRLLEWGISFKDLKIKEGEILGFQLQLKLNGKLIEEFPRMNLIELDVPHPEFDLIEWSV